MQLQRLTKAILFATDAHDGQTRKFTGEPYITHPMTVADIVAAFGGDIDMIITAYLHDTVEDVKRITHKIIEANFGDVVAAYVYGMTKNEYPTGTTRKEKKQKEAVRLAGCMPEVQTIKCADISHNSLTIIQHDVKFGEIYLNENLRAVEGMVNADAALRDYTLAVLKAELAKLEVLKTGQTMDTTIQEDWQNYKKGLAESLGMTPNELTAWGQTFQPSTKYFSEDDIPQCLYTDGDDGMILFSSFCECFADEGVTVKPLSVWCDIPFNTMVDISNTLEEMVEKAA